MIRMRTIAGMAILGWASVSAQGEEKPNILFIFADDQCYETVSAFGMTDIDTPNLDRLVERGTTFSHAYNMGSWSGAVCVASRHMLNTGAFVWKAEKIAENIGKAELPYPEWPDFQESSLMWSQLMQSGGYTTYFTGKWHVKAKPEKVFNVVRNVRGGMPAQTEAGYNRPTQGVPDKWSPYDTSFGGFWEGGKHWSEVVADDAIEFLSMAGTDTNPFFMYVAFNAPHDPRQAPKEYVDRYPEDRILIPENFLPVYPYHDKIDNRPSLRDERLAPYPRTEFAVKVHRQEYYAIITHMDAQIGRILDALDASGEAENTFIVFTADHGLAVGHHGLIGKQNLFDHSVRVPFMIVGPEIEAGKIDDAPIYLQDVMPTSLELGGIEIPEHVQFNSLLPVLAGESDGYDAIYGGYLESQRSIVKDGFKLLLYPNVPKILLFDLKNDPAETKDVSGEFPEKVESLFADLKELADETGDDFDYEARFSEIASAE